MSTAPIPSDLEEIVTRSVDIVATRLRPDHEGDPVEALVSSLSEGTDPLRILTTLVQATLEAVDLVGLASSRIELLAEYKLDYPQDYEESDIVTMRAEIEALRKLLADLA